MDEPGPSSGAVARYSRARTAIETCPVCKETIMLEDRYDVEVCYSCNKFFEDKVRKMFVGKCEHLGTCAVEKANLANCDFCRMSKCYNIGMDSTMVILVDSYYEKRDTRKNQEPPPLPSPFQLSWECAQYLDCLLFMEQHYYQWLNLSSEYRKLPEENKAILRKKSVYRGTALQLMERSLLAHDVLWLQHCFWDPYSCDMPCLRTSAVLILSFVMDCRDVNVDQDQFKFLKIKLALKDDVILKDEEDVPDDLYKRIDEIANDLKQRDEEGDINLRHNEDMSFISHSLLFEYSLYPERYDFPEHTIPLSQQEQGGTNAQRQEESLHRDQPEQQQSKEVKDEEQEKLQDDEKQADKYEQEEKVADDQEQKQKDSALEYHEEQGHDRTPRQQPRHEVVTGVYEEHHREQQGTSKEQQRRQKGKQKQKK